ncbi:MAG: hypothetical protein KAS21_01915 [Candidatus Aminicenantes bacterium]|nr:hypothetical protein [Candidatus Aminicenantes bacterium]
MKRNIFFLIPLLILLSNSVPAEPALTLISPNGGEELISGKTFMIKWNYEDSANSDKNVILVLYKNGIKFITISESTSNTGSFIWTIPSETPSGNKYRIRIRSQKELSLNDFSDRDFSILKQ